MHKFVAAAALVSSVGFAQQNSSESISTMEKVATTNAQVLSAPASIVNDRFVGSSYFDGTFSGRVNYTLTEQTQEANGVDLNEDEDSSTLELSATGKAFSNNAVSVLVGVDYAYKSLAVEGLSQSLIGNEVTPRVNGLIQAGQVTVNTFYQPTYTSFSTLQGEKETGIEDLDYWQQTVGASVEFNKFVTGLAYTTGVTEEESEQLGAKVIPAAINLYGKYAVLDSWTTGLSLTQNAFTGDDKLIGEKDDYLSYGVSSELNLANVRSEVLLTFETTEEGATKETTNAIKTYTGYAFTGQVEVGLNVNYEGSESKTGADKVESTDIAYGLSGSYVL